MLRRSLTALVAVTAVLACAVVAEPVQAQYCHRGYQCYTHSNYYVQPTYYGGYYQNYYPNYYQPQYNVYNQAHYEYKPDVVLVPKAVYVETNKDYYFSVGDSYRDALLADAIAYRTSLLQAAMQGAKVNMPNGYVPRYPTEPPDGPAKGVDQGQRKAQPAQPAVPAPQPTAGQVSIRTEVNPKLTEMVANRCLSCHQKEAPNNHLVLTDLATVPEWLRWKSHSMAVTAEMPKVRKGEKPAPIPDEEVVLLYEWAKSASAAAQATAQPSRKESKHEVVPVSPVGGPGRSLPALRGRVAGQRLLQPGADYRGAPGGAASLPVPDASAADRRAAASGASRSGT